MSKVSRNIKEGWCEAWARLEGYAAIGMPSSSLDVHGGAI